MNRREQGFIAEQKAADYLSSEGFSILDRNFQYRGGEIDIVAKSKDGCICFVEVKSASGAGWGDPIFNVTGKKQKQIGRVAEVWLAKNGVTDTSCRFDAVSVVGDKVTHYPDAFRIVGPAFF
ncbi:MAG: YraN family protein [Fibrobacteres bacterium]|nr:YraN family protein [Fibrobacterota bacterium]